MPESESTVAVVRDSDGITHYAARSSAFVQDGLANGELTEVEASRGATDASPGDGSDTGNTDDGSGDGERNAGSGDGGGEQPGVAKPTVRR